VPLGTCRRRASLERRTPRVEVERPTDKSPVNTNHHHEGDSMPEMTLTPKSVRIAEDEAKWLSAAATKGGVTQNDLVRLALHRLRKELGAASRIKPETVLATAKASKYKLTPPRAAAGKALSASREPTRASGDGKAKAMKAAPRTRAKRARTG
jgi:hypothetical protein